MSDQQITVSDNPDKSRYEAFVDGELAGFAAYNALPDRVVFTHTEIDDAFEGQGVGSVLVRAALDDVRARGLKVDPRCPFIKAWIERHPDYQELVA
jgi:predicted GNAT family acetyltransferase